MKFLKLDKKKGAGTPEIKGKFAFLVAIGDIATFPTIDEKGVRLLGNITFKPDCGMIPIYLSSSSQEFSYDVMGEDDEKTYKVKFMGTHPGTELEAMEFAKNQIEQPFLVLIPGCNLEEPWKLLGEITNPLIFTSTHKASRENSKFTFTFEQRIGSEFIYFSYGGVVIAPEVPGPNVPLNGFWAKVDASNIDNHIAAWRTKLGIGSIDIDFTQHGPITTTSNSVTIGLSPLGENFAEINGVKYIEPTTNPETPKPFTAVSPGKLKSVIIHALPDSVVFHLAEGIEGVEAIDPDYDGLLVKRIIVSDSGQVVEGDLDAFQLKANEAWVNLLLNNEGATIQTISIHHAALRFNIVSGASNIKIGGFRFYATRFLYDGVEITIRNESAGPLEITTIAGIGIISIDADGLPITLQRFESIDLAYHLVDGVFYALKSGGEVFDPTGLQGQINAEIVNRQIEDNKKLDKPTDDGSWVVTKSGSVFSYTSASSFGQNISNANLSNISARVFTQGNEFTWNTAGLKYYLKNLVDKTNQAAYSKVVIVHPTTGETVTRDFADPSATTLAVQNANATQKGLMRTALLGAGVPASPVINLAMPYFIKKEIDTVLFLSGVNLTPLEPTYIYIEALDGTKVYANNYFVQSTSMFFSYWNIPASFPSGRYKINLSFGSVLQGANNGFIRVLDSIVSTRINLTSSNSFIRPRIGFAMLPNSTEYLGPNTFNLSRLSTSSGVDVSQPDAIIKTSNLFKGDINSSWDIVIDIYVLSAGTGNLGFLDFIGFTETTDSSFNSGGTVAQNILILSTRPDQVKLAGNNQLQTFHVAGLRVFIGIRKNGNKLTVFYTNENNSVSSLYEATIDTTKDYALFFQDWKQNASNWKRQITTTIDIYNS